MSAIIGKNNYQILDDFGALITMNLSQLKFDYDNSSLKKIYEDIFKEKGVIFSLMFNQLKETKFFKDTSNLSHFEQILAQYNVMSLDDLAIRNDFKNIPGYNDNKTTLFDIYLNTLKQIYKHIISDSFKEIPTFINQINFSLQGKLNSRNFIFGEEKELNNPFVLLGTKNINNELEEGTISFINKWMKAFQIGKELIIHPIKVHYDTIGVSIFIKDFEGNEFPLNDNGLGINKILQTIITLALSEKNSIISFEEPESNLHPSLQSKLAELFCDAYEKFGCYFIIETHSEYLIRKVQYLIASKNGISNHNVSIYYLYDPKQIPDGVDQVYKLDIRDDGFMNNDFGKGFFDEASNLSLGLIKLN